MALVQLGNSEVRDGRGERVAVECSEHALRCRRDVRGVHRLEWIVAEEGALEKRAGLRGIHEVVGIGVRTGNV